MNNRDKILKETVGALRQIISKFQEGDIEIKSIVTEAEMIDAPRSDGVMYRIPSGMNELRIRYVQRKLRERE